MTPRREQDRHGYGRVSQPSASWCNATMARIGATRGVPDVAANADSATARVLEYSDGELSAAAGTSASTPRQGLHPGPWVADRSLASTCLSSSRRTH